MKKKNFNALGDDIIVEQSLEKNGKKIVYKRDLNVSQLTSTVSEIEKNGENKLNNYGVLSTKFNNFY